MDFNWKEKHFCECWRTGNSMNLKWDMFACELTFACAKVCFVYIRSYVIIFISIFVNFFCGKKMGRTKRWRTMKYHKIELVFDDVTTSSNENCRPREEWRTRPDRNWSEKWSENNEHASAILSVVGALNKYLIFLEREQFSLDFSPFVDLRRFMPDRVGKNNGRQKIITIIVNIVK